MNLVIQQHSIDPIPTLLFLDKSARPISFLFLTLWKLLQAEGKIPSNVLRPRIRYVNIGRKDGEKFSHPEAVELFSKLRNTMVGLGERVMVVDEIMQTKDTARVALRLIEEVWNIRATAIEICDIAPMWRLDEATGVVEEKINYIWDAKQSSDSEDERDQISKFIHTHGGYLCIRQTDEIQYFRSRMLREILRLMAVKSLPYITSSPITEG